jgi:uncharacterized protein YidB (DUF937 family)
MGLLDQIIGQGSGTSGGGGGSSALLNLALSVLNNSQTGGLSGLLQKFRDHGLGEHAASWVGTGENLPVSGDQVKEVVGDDEMQDMAEKAGVSREEASNHLAAMLPQLIDKLTPNGAVPQGGMLEQGLELLKRKLSGV